MYIFCLISQHSHEASLFYRGKNWGSVSINIYMEELWTVVLILKSTPYLVQPAIQEKGITTKSETLWQVWLSTHPKCHAILFSYILFFFHEMETLSFLLEAKSLEPRKHNLLNLYFTAFHEYWFQYYDSYFFRGKKKTITFSSDWKIETPKLTHLDVTKVPLHMTFLWSHRGSGPVWTSQRLKVHVAWRFFSFPSDVGSF